MQRSSDVFARVKLQDLCPEDKDLVKTPCVDKRPLRRAAKRADEVSLDRLFCLI